MKTFEEMFSIEFARMQPRKSIRIRLSVVKFVHQFNFKMSKTENVFKSFWFSNKLRMLVNKKVKLSFQLSPDAKQIIFQRQLRNAKT